MANTRVMVVEDERIVALNLKTRLVKLGYDVTSVATSGPQVLAEIERAPPDVVLMDIHIDGAMDGIETASRIPDELVLPVIYLTAYSEEATLARARTTRPYGYLLKPFSERELHATIQMVLERRRADLVLRESEKRLERLVEERTAELRATTRALEEEAAKRREAEAALCQAQKMEAIGHLTGGIAHDFNNLLAAVMGSLDVLSRVASLDVKAQRLIANALSATERGAKLTNQLLAFSRNQRLELAPIDVNLLLGGLSDLLERSAGPLIRVTFALDPAVKAATGDASQMENALLNLVINARDAMPGGGALTLSSAIRVLGGDAEIPAGNYVEIAVTDTGCGMEQEIAQRAFDPFFTTKGIGKGTGLGLSQVYGFARQAGGTARITSAVNGGTTVVLLLPVNDGVPAAPHAPANDIRDPMRPSSSEIVLVVDDDAQVREFLAASLESLGYRAVLAEDATRALALLSELIPDLLLVDYAMPGMNGVEFVRAARALRPNLPVVYSTGYSDQSVIDSVAKVTATLRKPYRVADLAVALQAALE